MTPFTHLDVLLTMREIGLIPVFNHPELIVCQNLVQAISDAGCPLGEFTIRGEFPLETFVALSKWVRQKNPNFMLGAGSVQDGETAVSLIHASAAFVVGPLKNLSMIKACNRYGVLGIPGCMTPTEFQEAMEAGCIVTKYFPGGVGGPEFLSALHGPCPQVQAVPTGKTSPSNIKEWFSQGKIFAAGMGSELFNKEKVADGDFKGIAQDIKNVLSSIWEARKGK